MSYLPEKDRVYTALSSKNGTCIRVMDQTGHVTVTLSNFRHKSVSINQRVVSIINERGDLIQMNPDGTGMKTITTR